MKNILRGMLLVVLGLSLSVCSFNPSSTKDKKVKVEKPAEKASASTPDYMVNGKAVPLIYCAKKLGLPPSTSQSSEEAFDAIGECIGEVTRIIELGVVGKASYVDIEKIQNQFAEIHKKLKAFNESKDYMLNGKVVPMIYCARVLNVDPKKIDMGAHYEKTVSEKMATDAFNICIKEVSDLAAHDKKLTAMQKQINEINQKLKKLEQKKQ